MIIKRDVKKRFGEFRKKLAQYGAKKVIYVDESRIDTLRELLYVDGVKKEKDTTANDKGIRRERISIIGALCEGTFFAPMVYQGYCTGKVIETRERKRCKDSGRSQKY